jgi:hypothetical protein
LSLSIPKKRGSQAATFPWQRGSSPLRVVSLVLRDPISGDTVFVARGVAMLQ